MKRRILALKRLVGKNKEDVIIFSTIIFFILAGAIVGNSIIPNTPKIVAIIIGALGGFSALYAIILLILAIGKIIEGILKIIEAFKEELESIDEEETKRTEETEE